MYGVVSPVSDTVELWPASDAERYIAAAKRAGYQVATVGRHTTTIESPSGVGRIAALTRLG